MDRKKTVLNKIGTKIEFEKYREVKKKRHKNGIALKMVSGADLVKSCVPPKLTFAEMVVFKPPALENNTSSPWHFGTYLGNSIMSR